jgi:hypothetical protein
MRIIGLLALCAVLAGCLPPASRSTEGQNTAGAESDPCAATEPATPRHLPPLPRKVSVECAAFSPDGKLLLTGYDIIVQPHEPGYCQYLRLWDVASGQELRVLKGHRDRVTGVAFLPDSKRAVSASRDGTWKLWDVTTGLALWTIQVPGGGTGPALSADGKLVLGCTLDGDQPSQLKLWDGNSGKLIRAFAGDPGIPRAISLSPDGHFALTAPQPREIGHGSAGCRRRVRLGPAPGGGAAERPVTPLSVPGKPTGPETVSLPPAAPGVRA